jgi:hypothetical protein
MSEIDVTDVILGAAVAGEEFVVIRRQETVTGQGQSSVQAFNYPAAGSVQPEGANDLEREADYDSSVRSIEVITPFRLRLATVDRDGKQFKPDIVSWKGNNYVVITVEDYSQFGRGLVQALCTSEDFVDEPTG